MTLTRYTHLLIPVALAACTIDAPRYVEPIDGSVIDVDAEPGCEADTIVCEADRYVACSSTGTVDLAIDCPLGCAVGQEKCIDLDPSNGLAGFLDRAGTDAASADFVFTGESTIDTDTGEVTNDGTVVVVLNDDFVNGTSTGRVLMFRSLEISGTLKVTGTRALAVVVDGDVTIGGLLDVSADHEVRGPGAFDPGDGKPCHAVVALSPPTPQPGGGGAGRFQVGGTAGVDVDGTPQGPAAGAIYDDDDIVPLVGGCRGGSVDSTFGVGGGGGAVQIVSRTRVVVGDLGEIDASGGGGRSGTYESGLTSPGGNGGGSGGTVLLEAPAVILEGSGVVSTKGGGGGAASDIVLNGSGSDGGTDGNPAPGGVITGLASGGNGGSYAGTPVPPGPGAMGTSAAASMDGGGGGGSVGQARFNTATGGFTLQGGAAVRSPHTTGPLATRFAPAD